jgi:hypothetical protein
VLAAVGFGDWPPGCCAAAHAGKLAGFGLVALSGLIFESKSNQKGETSSVETAVNVQPSASTIQGGVASRPSTVFPRGVTAGAGVLDEAGTADRAPAP